MKIAIYTGTIPSSTFIEHLIEGVAKHHKVLLFGTIKKPVQYNNPNMTIIETPTKQFKNVWLTGIRSFRLLFKAPKLLGIAIREALTYKTRYEQWMRFSRFVPVLLHQPHVFHVQWAKKLSRWLFLQEAYGGKVVVSLRGAHINYTPIANPEVAKQYQECFPFVDAFHAVSQAIAKEATKYGAAVEKIKIIHSPIPESTFLKFKERLSREGDKNKISICCVGRYHWKKGYPYALQAINSLKNKGYNPNLTIIASGVVSEEVKYLIQDLDLHANVNIMGGLPQEELFNTMQQFDVLLLPSVEEGIANVVLEAMAIGLPVVSTNCGGMPEVVNPNQPNQTGWLVPVRDPEAMAQAIIDMHKTPNEQIQTITQQAHDFVKAQFNAKDSIQQFLALYEAVVREHK